MGRPLTRDEREWIRRERTMLNGMDEEACDRAVVAIDRLTDAEAFWRDRFAATDPSDGFLCCKHCRKNAEDFRNRPFELEHTVDCEWKLAHE